VEVANRLKKALDVEKVTKGFFKEFQKLHERSSTASNTCPTRSSNAGTRPFS